MSSTLEDHEEICAQRYADIERRITNVENKVEKLNEDMNNSFKRTTNLILTGFSLIISTIGIIGTIIGLNI